MACPGSAVPMTSDCVGGSARPSRRFRSSVHSSSNASTPNWRARSHSCSEVSRRLADHISAGASSARWGNSSRWSKRSGSVSQG